MRSFLDSQQPRKNNSMKMGYTNFELGKPTIFRKESIKNKKLSKWGDADMDGSPNQFDCDPRNVGADGRRWSSFKRKVSRVVSKIKSTFKPPKKSPSVTRITTRTIAPRGPAPKTVSKSGGGPSRSSSGGVATSASPGWVYKEPAKDPVVIYRTGNKNLVMLQSQKVKLQKQVRERVRERKSFQLMRKNVALQQAAALKQRAAQLKSLEIQRALAAKVPKLTAAQKALMRKQGIVSLSHYVTQQRLARNLKFRSLKQREFERDNPGYYYNPSFF